MSEAMQAEAAAIFNIGRETKMIEQVIEGVHHVLVPPGCKLEVLKDLEKRQPAPLRIVASPTFHDIAGFAGYTKEFAQEGTRIFVNESKLSFFTIFDCHAKDMPAWGDHSASMMLQPSSEWVRFKQADGKAMEPLDFAEFLEDNLEYISAANMTASDLLTLAQNFKIDFKGNLNVHATLQAGLRHLEIRDDGVPRGQGEAGTALEFPEILNLKIRIFKYQTTYELPVRLRYRTSKETVSFFIKIGDVAGIEEKAFNEIMKEVGAATDLPICKGAYIGTSHK